MTRKCKWCGKVLKKYGNQKFCNRTCYAEYKRNTAMPVYRPHGKKGVRDTICWECRNANDSCPWHSEKHSPVPGWSATPTRVRMSVCGNRARYADSYIVHECPGFEKEERRDIKSLWSVFAGRSRGRH